MSARVVISRFGGQTALAKLLGKGQSTVGYWAKSDVIPARWHGLLLDLARREGVPLSPHDFLSEGASRSAATPGYQDAVLTQEAPLVEGDQEVPTAQTNSPFLFYTGKDGSTKIQVMVEEETVWASQRACQKVCV